MPRVTMSNLEDKIRKLDIEVGEWRHSVEEVRAIANRSRAWAVIEGALVAYKLAYDAWVDAKSLLGSYLIRIERHAKLCSGTLAAGRLDASGAIDAGSVYAHAGLTADNYADRATAVESMRARAVAVLQNSAPLIHDDHTIIDKILALVGEEAAKKLGGWQPPVRPMPPPDEGGRG